jgi:hydroxyacylglutathione hydrolase
MSKEVPMEPYSVMKFAEQFYVIDEGGVRCFLITGEEHALLIDTGFGGGDLKAQVAELTGLPVRVVQTHTDGDHIGSSGQFADILMHPAEFAYFKQNGNTHPGLKAIWDGDWLACGPYTFQVILIPGHTPGSIALLEEQQRWLIGGDSIQAGPAFMFGEGRSMAAYAASMRKLDGMRPAFDHVLASHGPLCLPADILPELVEGAELQLAGRLEGKNPQLDLPHLPSCRLYSHKRAMFLCE